MKDSIRFQELDALRGWAALMIVIFHFTLGKEIGEKFFFWGATGVDLFFMISGFVIFFSIKKVKSSTHFIVNRFSRLYPSYWSSVCFTFFFIVLYSLYKEGDFTRASFVDFFGNLTMFQFYLGIKDIDGPYWTLIIELLFYLFVLIIYHFRCLKYIDFFSCTLILLSLVMGHFYLEVEWVENIFYNFFPLLQHIALFYAGILFYKIKMEKNHYWIRYGLVILCLVSQISQYKFSGRCHLFMNHFEYSTMLVIYFILFSLFINEKLRFITIKPFLFLGAISYPLYLIHDYVGSCFLLPMCMDILKVNEWIAIFMVAVPFFIGLASFIFFYIERPLSTFFRKYLSSFL